VGYFCRTALAPRLANFEEKILVPPFRLRVRGLFDR